MKRSIVAVLLLLALALGWVLGNGGPPTGQSMTENLVVDDDPEILYWVAPMDASYRRDRPGKSPMGMDLVPVYANDDSTAGAVSIRPNVENNLGVKTAVVERGPLWRRMNAPARVAVDEGLTSHVSVRTAGWIEVLRAKRVGQWVTEGEVLFELYAPALISAQREFLSVRKRGSATLEAAARDNLMALGMTSEQIEQLTRRLEPLPRVSVLAPRSGFVIELQVAEGMQVVPGRSIMTVADLSRVFVLARHPQHHSNWLAVGQAAEVTLTGYPGRRWEATVEYLYPQLDPGSQTMVSRLLLDNSERRFRPDMLAEVTVFGGAAPDVLSIPIDALIRGGEVDRVVVALGDGQYQVQEVVAGMESGDWVEIRAGLEVGTRVVTSAQFLIDSEASLRGAIRRLSPHQRPPGRGQ